jgi:hypothetical protein
LRILHTWVALCSTRCLFDRKLCVCGFPHTHTYATLFVADHDCNREVETATACHHTGDTSDADHFLRKLRAFAFRAVAAAARTASVSSASVTVTSTTLRTFL